MVLPLRDVGDIFYQCTTKKLLDKLQVLQNRALCIIFKLPSRTNMDVFHLSTGLLFLVNRRKLHSLQLANWLATDASHVVRHDLPTRSHAKDRRNQWVERPNKTKYLNSMAYLIPLLWNNFPTIAQNIPDPLEFMTLIKQYLPSI